MKILAALAVVLIFGSIPLEPAFSAKINFDDSSLNHLSDITNFYPGVRFNGIDNSFHLSSGAYPVPSILPEITRGAATWDPYGLTAPGESPGNFAVGLGSGHPGDYGILIAFDHVISAISLTGLDFGNNGADIEQMTLSAYDKNGKLIGYEHFTTQFVEGAIKGRLSFSNMKFVAFNYTNTHYGFYGIDDLSYTPAAVPVPAAIWLMGSGLIALIGFSRKHNKALLKP